MNKKKTFAFVPEYTAEIKLEILQSDIIKLYHLKHTMYFHLKSYNVVKIILLFRKKKKKT